MKLVGIIDEDFVNYKKVSMTLEFPYCSFKCDKDANCNVCQNSLLSKYEVADIDNRKIIEYYQKDPITESIVCQGLEPLDSWDELYEFIKLFREQCNDDIVIYTGYTEKEVKDFGIIIKLLNFKNIIIKFGRFVPNDNTRFDNILGVTLASSNQYARKIS